MSSFPVSHSKLIFKQSHGLICPLQATGAQYEFAANLHEAEINCQARKFSVLQEISVSCAILSMFTMYSGSARSQWRSPSRRAAPKVPSLRSRWSPWRQRDASPNGSASAGRAGWPAAK